MNQPRRRSRVGLWLGAATAAMCALAGGAIWSVLELHTGRDLAWFAFVCAAVVVWALRANGWSGSRAGAVIAAACTAVACVYAQALLAVGDVAQALGYSMRDTLVRIGVDFTLAIVRGRISPWDSTAWGLAIAAAAWLVLRRSRPARPPRA